MIYKTEDLLEANITQENIDLIDKWASSLFEKVWDGAFIVYEWDAVPDPVRQVLSFRGGDEDYLIIMRKIFDDLEMQHLVEPPYRLFSLDSCYEPDEYRIGSHRFFVCSHA